jgi:1-aminocyclopropane-1-carboxylate deaminase/D-cysteine desulfhydrase-like pyridoxal-dependent ACC family enzyme
LLLNDLLGASVQFVEVESQEHLNEAKQTLMERLVSEGRKPFMIMQPDVRHFGAMGYALCMAELVDQFSNLGETLDTLVVCSGSTTQPGLIFGNRVLGMDTRIIGMAPIVWSHDLKKAFLDVLGKMTQVMDLDLSFSADDIINLASYVGPRGYGYASPEGNDAFRMVARLEGIFLDPIYSGKAFAGLADLVRKGQIGSDETVAFLHTGGTPLLFAYAEELGA